MNKGLAAAGALAVSANAMSRPAGPGKQPGVAGKLLNAYYFRAHMYTMVPRHVREDMKWMAGVGTNVVSIAVLEQDLYAAVENIQVVCEEAQKAGMAVHAVPSRWGGLLAGAPKVPSMFSVTHPHTWMLHEDGKPAFNGTSGVTSSIHYPETHDFFCKSVDGIVKIHPNLRGVIWDEPKNFRTRDFSPKAKEVLGADAPVEKHIQAMADFYSRVNEYVKGKHPQLTLSMFVYASTSPDVMERAAAIAHLDYFGCDGRPWGEKDGGQLEGDNKVLVGRGEAFLEAARKNGKKGLLLIENHNLPARDIPLMDRGMPQVLRMNPEQLIYYYYPRNIGEPDRNMATLAKHLRKYGD